MVDTERCRFTVPQRGRFLLWEVTRFCNLECRHCCTYSSPSVSVDADVPTERMVAVAQALSEAGVEEVLFSGGEPFLRRDMMQIVSVIDPARTRVYIASNGTTIRERTVDELRRLQIAGVDISLDGHTTELHQIVRLHPTSFDGAVRGIEACVRGGLTLRVTSVITPLSAAHVEDLIKFLVGLGVPHVVFQTVLQSGGRAVEHPDLVLAKSAIPQVEEQVERAKVRWRGEIEIDFRAGQFGGGADGCPAGHHLLNISAEGDVSTCSWLYKISPERFTLGNIKDCSLTECIARTTDVMEPWTRRTSSCPIPLVSVEAGKGVLRVYP